MDLFLPSLLLSSALATPPVPLLQLPRIVTEGGATDQIGDVQLGDLEGGADWQVPQVSQPVSQVGGHRAAVLLQDLRLDRAGAVLEAAELGDEHLDIQGV